MIRPARAEDAPAVARVQARAWAHAYADFLEPEAFAARPVGWREERWREALADPATSAWVWDQGGTVVAFAAAGPARDEDAGERTGEVYAIYVDPHAQGAGLGSALLARALDGLRERGHVAAVVWTFEANGLARRFYERHGWSAEPEAAGEHAVDLAPCVRYRREL